MECQICFTEKDEELIIHINNNHDIYCKNCLSLWITNLNLSIDLDLADLEEWVITGINDTFDDNVTIRLRNPKTNIPYTQLELEQIYNFIKS